MNYQQPGNFLQDQGYFQINTTVKELATNPSFKLFLSGQYLLELVDVSVDSQFFLFADTNIACSVFNLTSPQFSSTVSETPGVTFVPPLLITHKGGTNNTLLRYSGFVKPTPNKILATLNGSITLNVNCFELDSPPDTDAFYEPIGECIIPSPGAQGIYGNMVFSFGFQYSRVR